MKKKEDEKRRLEDKIGSAVSIIAPGTKFKGTIQGQDTLFISGHFKGEIKCEGLVRVDKAGRIVGTINSPYVIIEGEIKGDIRVEWNRSESEFDLKLDIPFDGEAEILIPAKDLKSTKFGGELSPKDKTFKDGKLRCRVTGPGSIHIKTSN